MAHPEQIAVVLSGGGARGAYQAGVLKGIAEIFDSRDCPFRIISGLSAGAISGVALAAGAEDFLTATQNLWSLWADVSTDEVYVTGAAVMVSRFFQWFQSLASGGALVSHPPAYMFDTSPLHQLLQKNVDFKKIGSNVKDGTLHAVSVSATNYQHDRAVSFFTAARGVKAWSTNSQCGRPEVLTANHVLASAALPVLFRAQRIDSFDYGDGGIALKAPLSPAIRLGADKLCVIGIQSAKHGEITRQRVLYRRVSIGDVAGTLLNTMLFGSLSDDIKHCEDVNRAVRRYPALGREFRVVPVLGIMPSRDIGALEGNDFENFPFTVRHLLQGFGISHRKSWDLMSYLAFHPEYTRTLLKLGRADALAQRRQIRAFFKKGGGTT